MEIECCFFLYNIFQTWYHIIYGLVVRRKECMNSLYGRLIQKIYERSYAQCSAAGGKKLYAADCHTSGCGSAAGNRGVTQQSYGLQWLLCEGTFFYMIFKVMSNAGNIVFTNLPLIFAMGVALGMAKKEKEVAVLASAISFFTA